MNAPLSSLTSLKSDQLFTQAQPYSLAGSILQFPLTRMVIIILFLAPAAILHNLFVDRFLFSLPKALIIPAADLERVVNFILFILLYRLYTSLVEHRKAHELSANGSIREFGFGFLISAAIVVSMVAIMEIFGYYRVESLNSPLLIIHCFIKFGMGAFMQRLVFSLILFRLIEEWAGSWAAIVSVALIFGGVHIGNENATVWTTLALVAADGITLAAAFMLTRRVWLVWGLHTGWNYLQDGIFGMPNSGITTFESWINPAISGPGWITGGSFGIEASVVAVLMELAVGLWLLKLAADKEMFVRPAWRRTRRREQTGVIGIVAPVVEG